jgi:hypothetical protein
VIPYHPVRLRVEDDLRRSRLTVFFRLVLVIPHLIWLYVWSWVVVVVVAFNWLATLFAGRTEDDVHNFNGRFLRYWTQIYAYVCLAANPWPRFSGRPGTYPVELELDPPEPQRRLVTLFRVVLVIPAFAFAIVLGTVAQVLALVGWFICLALGASRKECAISSRTAFGTRRRRTRTCFLLTSRYPSLASSSGFQFEEA